MTSPKPAERAVDLTKPVQTRDGRPVRILATDRKAKDSIVGLVANPDGYEMLGGWKPDGAHYTARGDDLDLVNVPQERTVWLNCYADTCYVHDTLAEANHAYREGGDSRIACIRVTYTEGQFDE